MSDIKEAIRMGELAIRYGEALVDISSVLSNSDLDDAGKLFRINLAIASVERKAREEEL